jgi:rhodanese-related sulfurtransferase
MKKINAILAVTIMIFIIGIGVSVGRNGNSNKPNQKVLGSKIDTEEKKNTKEEQKYVYEKISVDKIGEVMAENEGLKIIDIRTKQEFDEGSIEGAINIDYYGDFRGEIEKLHKNVVYLIYCQSGGRTAEALEIFKDLGFSKIYVLEPGYLGYK